MPTPLLTIAGAGINLGDRWLLRGGELTLHAGDRLALVGRNGAGKSSLMKLMAGRADMDEGSLWMAPGSSVAYLPQAPEIPPGMTLRSVVTAGHDADWLGRPVPIHKAEEFLMRLGLDPDRLSDGLSGGESRRVSLARALYTEPDVLLLDEPTNHMDMPTIEWMEQMLGQHRGALLVVSHDRAFLRNLGTGIVWLHNGRLRRREGDFAQFDSWSEGIIAEEAVVLHKMDRRIAAETKWSREGISARRKRNQGRLRELEALRLERARTGGITQRAMKMETGPAEGGGQLVLEAIDLSVSVPLPPNGGDSTGTDDSAAARRQLLSHFNMLVRRSDRIGIVGPNGIGKSTLVRVLLGLASPDGGRVRQGFGLNPAYFDQQRSALDRNSSPWTVLTGGSSDMIEVAGQQKHVTAYLRDFLFDDHKMTQKVATLSGGEQNRLLLAKLFAETHNFLVLDEPTNDLDMETLDLLQEVIAEYDGTILIVSHDRDFLDRTVTSLLAFEGGTKVSAHAGGYSEYLERRTAAIARRAARESGMDGGRGNRKANGKSGGKGDGKGGGKTAQKPSGNRTARLSFKDRHALDTLPGEIAALEAEIAELEARLADPAFFTSDPDGFAAAADRLAAAREDKEAKETRWLDAAAAEEALQAG
ncbi:MAG: ATP-binding cassette domain-containing protein [Alphaproteobacteria bacterium]|nr:ATP-binding cassette domain-containing protein [Alphaproteobacteria bacterium]